jgi:hypothetical protein
MRFSDLRIVRGATTGVSVIWFRGFTSPCARKGGGRWCFVTGGSSIPNSMSGFSVGPTTTSCIPCFVAVIALSATRGCIFMNIGTFRNAGGLGSFPTPAAAAAITTSRPPVLKRFIAQSQLASRYPAVFAFGSKVSEMSFVLRFTVALQSGVPLVCATEFSVPRPRAEKGMVFDVRFWSLFRRQYFPNPGQQRPLLLRSLPLGLPKQWRWFQWLRHAAVSANEVCRLNLSVEHIA